MDKVKLRETMEFYRGYIYGILELDEKGSTIGKVYLREITTDLIDEVFNDLEVEFLRLTEVSESVRD